MAESSPFYGALLEEVKRIAGDGIVFEERSHRADEQTLHLPKSALVPTMAFLQKQGFDFLMDLCGVDYPGLDERFEVVYHLYSSTSNRRLRVRVKTAEDSPVPSLTGLWKGANWHERETFDMFGIKFEGHPDLRRILCHTDFKGHPLRKDYPADLIQPMTSDAMDHVFEADRQRLMRMYDEDLMWINIGPAHPATHGTLRFMAVVDGGETIREVDSEIGYLHRCFEKMCETHNYNQIIPYTDRLNYCSAPINNNAFATAVEKMFGVTVPPRALMMRMILDEFSRCIDHLVCIGTNVMDIGALTAFFYMFQERESVYTLFEKLCGARLTVSLTRIGGQGFDLPPGWVQEANAVVDRLEKCNAEMDSLISNNRIFVNRAVGAGPIDKATAIQYGFTGPCLRATGVEYDVRKASPYYFYDQVEFDVPVGQKGDTYDRYLVRMEEMRQSIRILRWALKNIPEGEIKVPQKNISLPDKKDVYGNIEGLMNHFMLVINGVQPPAGEIYHKVEGGNGELGFYIVSDGSGTPHRLRCRPPCFAIMSGFGDMVRGGRIADAVAALGSINIIAGELDR